MDKIKQLTILFGLTFLSEFLYKIIGLPIPASIYGLILLFCCLQFGIIKIESIEEIGGFLLVAMPLFFIAPGVNLMNVFEQVSPILWRALLLIFISTILVTVITGKMADYLLTRGKKHE